jgi:predicted DNA-binding ribbon-helix-helix protein
MDSRTRPGRPKKSGVKKPISEEPAFQRLLELLAKQSPERVSQLLKKIEDEIKNESD